MDRVLVMAEEAASLDHAVGVCAHLGIEVSQITRHAEVRRTSADTVYSLILLYLEQEDRTALEEVMPRLSQAWPDTPVALVVSHPSVEFALTAFRLGAFDLLVQPLTGDTVAAVLCRARAWRQTQLVRKLQSLVQFCGWFTHEVRNPLSGILTSGQVLMEGSNLTDHSREYLKIIVEESLRLEQFLHRLGEIGRMPQRQMTSSSLNAVVERALTVSRPQIQKHGICLTWQPGDRLPKVSIDADQVEHAISLVISNALETTPRGGELSLLTRHRLGEMMVELEVASTGDGAGPVDERLLFDPFLSRKSSGRELGLTHALLTFAHYGGTVSFRSRPGHSRTFYLQLPVARPAARRSQGTVHATSLL